MHKQKYLFTQKEEIATADFVDIIIKFFDCLNIRNYTEVWDSRNVFKQPHHKIADFWLQVRCKFRMHNWKNFDFYSS